MLKHLKQKLIMTLITVLACVPAFANAEPIIMGYWENWSTYNNFPMINNAVGSTNPVLQDQLTSLNTLAYAFLQIAQDGSIVFSDVWSDLAPKNLQDQRFCATSPNSCPNYPKKAGLGNFSAFTKTPVKHHVVSIGGAGHDQDWLRAFTHPDQFVSSLKTLVNIYNVDWLDIDYEPLGGVSAQTIDNFIELTTKIKATIPNLILSYPIMANKDNVKHFGAANWKKLDKNLNYVSIMGYDIHGVFDTSAPYTALHSALVATHNGYSTESTIQALNQAGIANSKIILGMPLYGRAVGGVKQDGLGQLFTQAFKGDLDQPHCSTDLKSNNVCESTFQYKTLVHQGFTPIPVTIKNQLSGVYAFDPTKNLFVSYDNAESASAKAQYAIDHQLAGVMYWALRFDMPYSDPQSIVSAVDKVYRKFT